jgi:trk system potassium uptake protein TrkA
MHTTNPNITDIKCMTGTDAEALEFLVPEGAAITRAPLREIGFPKDAIVGGGIRNDTPFIATGDTQILAGDRVVIFALPTAMDILSKFFS